MKWAVVGASLLVVIEILFWLFVGKLFWQRWGKNDSRVS